MRKATKALTRFPLVFLVALLVVGLVAVIGASRTVAAGRGIVDMPSRVQTQGLTADEQIQRQMDLTGRLLKDLPSATQLKQVRINLGRDEIDAIDHVDRSSTPLKIGLVKVMTPAVEVHGLSRGPASNLPGQGVTSEAMKTQDGGYVWALAIASDQAGAIRVHVENLTLPEGAELYVYSRGGEVYGPYTSTGVDESGEFWAPAVFGREVIVQVRVYGPAGEAFLRDVSLRISEVAIITEKNTSGLSPVIEAGSFCGNPSCIVDASCYSAANSIKDAYAKQEWVQGAYIYTCTGGLLNDSNPTQDNFFLTANHCYSKSNTAKNVSFYWRFRTSTCNGSCPSNNGWPYKTTGASVAASNRKGDYTLVHLNSAPPSGSVFLGFTSAPVANSNGVGLHRVSNPNFGPQVYNEQSVSTSAPTCSGWPRGERIYSRDTLGGTDGGSSGSPVVNSSDQVVGQLSGACGTNVNDPCDNVNNATVDGAFAFYWASVQPILAP
jgi:V8-like Glu-specific endopeptidase